MTINKKSKKPCKNFSSADYHSSNLRLPTCPDEMYGRVSRMLGQGNCVVVTEEGEKRCVIRSKFSGKSKRQNYIGVGSIVLVGKYGWSSSRASSAGKLETCDLLETYGEDDDKELTALFGTKKVPPKIVMTNDGQLVVGEEDLVFSNTVEHETFSTRAAPSLLKENNYIMPDVDFDDI